MNKKTPLLTQLWHSVNDVSAGLRRAALWAPRWRLGFGLPGALLTQQWHSINDLTAGLRRAALSIHGPLPGLLPEGEEEFFGANIAGVALSDANGSGKGSRVQE